MYLLVFIINIISYNIIIHIGHSPCWSYAHFFHTKCVKEKLVFLALSDSKGAFFLSWTVGNLLENVVNQKRLEF